MLHITGLLGSKVPCFPIKFGLLLCLLLSSNCWYCFVFETKSLTQDALILYVAKEELKDCLSSCLFSCVLALQVQAWFIQCWELNPRFLI